MRWFTFVFAFVGLFLDLTTDALFNRTYGNLEFISPGYRLRSLSSAQSWCRQHGSTLAEISSEHIWNLTSMFLDEFEIFYIGSNLILNARGEELPAWKWIPGENFTDMASYPLSSNDTKMYARLSGSEGGIISVEGSLPDCLDYTECRHGYVCEVKDVSRCDGQSYYMIVLDRKCYKFYDFEYLNWFEAYDACERNNGRLATFRNLKEHESQLAAHLNQGMKYWIGLNRYEWRWIDSGKLLTYTHFKTYPLRGHSCLTLYNIGSRKLRSLQNCTQERYTFICIKDTTQCASNSCRNGETCVGSIHNHSCECIEGGQCRTVVNKCDSDPCGNGGTCIGDVNNYKCQCAYGFSGSHCETYIDKCRSDPCQNGATCYYNVNSYACLCAPGFTGSHCHISSKTAPDMMTIVIVQTVVIIIISTILVVVCIRKRNKTRKSNDAELATRYETRNSTSVLDNHIYSDITGSDGQNNIGADGRQPAGQEGMIYEHVV